MAEPNKVYRDREILTEAQAKGTMATIGAFARLSGPGWLQSAITLGGGSLTGALFLGVLGGTSMLWLQLMAIIMGVIMLSAISYVTLSTGKRPFQAINEYVNPVLGCGWLLATSMANMIWCMPQFSLSYAALNKNLAAGSLNESTGVQLGISAVLLVLAFILVVLNERQGLASKIFDVFLKGLVGLVVICFFGVVIYLITKEGLQLGEILAGFIPDLRQWSNPTGKAAELLQQIPETMQAYWSGEIVNNQRDVMIGAAATAVGINMTFLLPYSMLARGWDKPFRGLARFDLSTGMAIPYVLVTSCVVIASAYSFHGKVDESFLSSDPATMKESPIFASAQPILTDRIQFELGSQAAAEATAEARTAWVASLSESDQKLSEEVLEKRYINTLGAKAISEMSEDALATTMAALPDAEKKLAGTVVKRDAFQLAQSLAPLLGDRNANFIFGLGVLGMGFSSIIILMLINGYVYRELVPEKYGNIAHYVGCLVAGITGALWPFIWNGPSKLWLAIVTSTFGMMLLPIAYITFFFLMNNKKLLGDEKPTGGSLIAWNIAMGISVIGATVAAGSAMWQKMSNPTVGPTMIGIAVFFVAMSLVGFAARTSPAESKSNA